MTAKYLILILAVLALLISPGSAWLANEPYGKNLSVTGNGNWNGDISYYTLPVTIYRSTGTDSGSSVYVSTNCNANYSDIRFTDASDNLLPYDIETSDSSSATAWVNITSVAKSSATTYKMYYGNTSFSPVFEPNTTWKLYDHFNGTTINASKWTSSGTMTVLDSKVYISNYDSYIKSSQVFGDNTFILTNMSLNSVIGINHGTAGYDGAILHLYDNYYGTTMFEYPGAQTSTGFPTDSFHNLLITKTNGGNIKAGYSIDGSAISYYSSTLGTGTSQVAAFYGGYAGTTPKKNDTYDWVRVGTRGYGDPSYSWTDIIAVSAAFSANTTSVIPGGNVSFTDSSTGSPDRWWWSFGDSNTSTAQNPTHIYYSAGIYTVNLTVQKSGGLNSSYSRTNYINVGQPPTAAFTTNKTSGTNPLGVLFTDASTGGTPTFWNWSFGEGGANTTTQNAVHTYTSSGSYQVILTAGNAYGSTSATATITVQSSGNASGYGQYYATKTLTLHVQTAWGAPIAGAQVTATGQNTTSGSWDWLGQLLGVRFNETPINTWTMNGATDSRGDVQFMVLPTAQYTFVITSGGDTQTLTISPTEERYTVIFSPFNIFGSDPGNVLAVTSFNTTTAAIDGSTMGIYVHGNDTLNHITGGTVYLNQSVINSTTETTISSQGIPSGSNFTLIFPVTNYTGQSYIVRIRATHSDFGTVDRDFGISFPKDAFNPMGISSEVFMWISMAILVLTGAVFTRTTAHQGMLIVCFVGWILSAVGFASYGGITYITGLTLASVLSIAVIITRGGDR